MSAKQIKFAVDIIQPQNRCLVGVFHANNTDEKFDFMRDERFGIIANPVSVNRYYEPQIQSMFIQEPVSIAEMCKIEIEALNQHASYAIKVYDYTVLTLRGDGFWEFDSHALFKAASVVFRVAREQEKYKHGAMYYNYESVCDYSFKERLNQIASFADSSQSATNIIERLALMGNLINFEFGFSCGLERLRIKYNDEV